MEKKPKDPSTGKQIKWNLYKETVLIHENEWTSIWYNMNELQKLLC